MTTFGPDYRESRDGQRLGDQRDAIRDWMLSHGAWKTPREISRHFAALGVDYPTQSVEAQLRHLRKARFGGYRVPRRKRTVNGRKANYSEYRVLEPTPAEFKQAELAFAGTAGPRTGLS